MELLQVECWRWLQGKWRGELEHWQVCTCLSTASAGCICHGEGGSAKPALAGRLHLASTLLHGLTGCLVLQLLLILHGLRTDGKTARPRTVLHESGEYDRAL